MLITALVLVACGSPDRFDDDDDDDASADVVPVAPVVRDTAVGGGCGQDLAVTPGIGEDQFVELIAGDSIPLVEPQLSNTTWHVYAAGEVVGALGSVEVRPTMRRASDGEVLDNLAADVPFNVQLSQFDDTTCTGVFYGVQFHLDVHSEDEACALVGESVELELLVTDLHTGATGRVARHGFLVLEDTSATGCN